MPLVIILFELQFWEKIWLFYISQFWIQLRKAFKNSLIKIMKCAQTHAIFLKLQQNTHISIAFL